MPGFSLTKCIAVAGLAVFLGAAILLVPTCSNTDKPDEIIYHPKHTALQSQIAQKAPIFLLAETQKQAAVWKLTAQYPEQQLDVPQSLGNITGIAISAHGDYALIVTNNHVSLWGLTTGELYASWQMPDTIISAGISEDGKYALLGLANHQAQFIDIRTGTLIHQFNYDTDITQVALSPNGQYALITGSSNTAKLWQTYTGELLHVWIHKDIISHVAISSNQQYAITGSDTGEIKIWQVKSGELISEIAASPEEITSLAIADNGLYAAIASSPQTLQLWQIIDKKLVKTWMLPKKHFFKPLAVSIDSLAFNQASTILYAQDSDGTCYVWTVPDATN